MPEYTICSKSSQVFGPYSADWLRDWIRRERPAISPDGTFGYWTWSCGEPARQTYDWVIRDAQLEIVPLVALFPRRSPRTRFRRFSGRHCRARHRWFRRCTASRTYRESHGWSPDTENPEWAEPPVRGRRKGWATVFDDFPRKPEKSWKSHRRTQYKAAR
ncbi:hypothetical protein [Thiomonas sp.]